MMKSPALRALMAVAAFGMLPTHVPAETKPHLMEERLKPAKRRQADNRNGGGSGGRGWVKNRWASRNKYSGAQLRKIRERNGVGRPPHINLARMNKAA